MLEDRGHLEIDNGSKLYWFREKSKNVGLALLVPFGSAHEKREQRGITHLLEHLIFKSNRKYTAREMNKIVELSGGEWNASTYWDSFVVQMEFLAANYKKMFNVFESAILNDKFIEKEFEREKEVVLTEIKEHMNDPITKMYILVRKAIYGDSDLGDPIGGYPETVERISFEDILEHKTRTFKSRNMVMVLIGGVNEDILNRAKETLEKIEDGVANKKRPSRGKGRDLYVNMDTGDICYLAYGWELPVLNMFKQTMLEYLMVVGSTSLLYDVIREERGLAYSFGSSSDMTHQTGYIAFGVEGFHCEKKDEIKELILDLIDKIKRDEISDELIAGKKNAIDFGKEKYRHFYAERAEDTARRIYLGNPVESIEYAKILINSSWRGINEIISNGYFVNISP